MGGGGARVRVVMMGVAVYSVVCCQNLTLRLQVHVVVVEVVLMRLVALLLVMLSSLML